MLNSDLSFLLDGPANIGDADESWVQVAKTGSFSDPRYGKFKITLADFNKWINNFQADVGHGPLGLPVDVDHSPEKKGDTEAVGWVKNLERRGDQLWAFVQWNPVGKELIAEKRYGYISPSYNPNYKDENGRQHGTAMVGIALTNRPFLSMATVNLSEFTFARRHVPPKDTGDSVGLNPGDTTDLDDTDLSDQSLGDNCMDDLMLDVSDAQRQKHAVVVKKIGGQTRHMFPIPPGDKVHARAALELLPRSVEAGHITPEEASAIKQRAHEVLGTAGKQHSYSLDKMNTTQILEAMGLDHKTLGLAADADEDTVLAAIKTHTQAPPSTDSVTFTKDQATQLLADANAGRAAAEELRLNKFETAFTTAQKDGKVVPAQRETYLSLYDADAEHTLKLLSELQPVVSMTPIGTGAGPVNLDADAQRALGEYQDRGAVGERYDIDTEMLKLAAAADRIEREKKVSYEEALTLAQAETGITL